MTPVLPQASEAQVLDFFKQAAKDLFDVIQRAKTGSTFYRYRLEQLHAITDIIQRLDSDSKDWVNENIPQVMQQASDAVTEQIQKQDETQFQFNFGGVPEDAVKILTTQSYLDFGNTITMLGKNAQRAAMNKLAIQRKIIQATIQGNSTSKTQADILDSLKAQVNAVQYSNGSKYPVEAYVNMLVRTQTMKAYNVAASQQMLAAGRMFAIFPTLSGACPICQVWEQKRYINLLTDPVPPDSTHPNCRHSLQPISFAELQAERPDLYAEALAYFDKTAG